VQDNYPLFVDSQSIIHLGKNPTFHSRSKFIDVRYTVYMIVWMQSCWS